MRLLLGGWRPNIRPSLKTFVSSHALLSPGTEDTDTPTQNSTQNSTEHSTYQDRNKMKFVAIYHVPRQVQIKAHTSHGPDKKASHGPDKKAGN